jgi:hypothetical protein
MVLLKLVSFVVMPTPMLLVAASVNSAKKAIRIAYSTMELPFSVRSLSLAVNKTQSPSTNQVSKLASTPTYGLEINESVANFLFDSGINSGELIVHLSSQGAYRRNRDNRNQGHQESVLHEGRALLLSVLGFSYFVIYTIHCISV